MEGFVSVTQAIDLKDIGFNEPSLAYYTFATEKLCLYGATQNGPNHVLKCTHENIYKDYSLAPLNHDVLKWFRKKGYGIEVYSTSSENKDWHFLIKKGTITTSDVIYNSQEEAEKECIDKLIEIEKLKQR